MIMQTVLSESPLPYSSSASEAQEISLREAKRILWLLKARANVNQWDILPDLSQLELILEACVWATQHPQESPELLPQEGS